MRKKKRDINQEISDSDVIIAGPEAKNKALLENSKYTLGLVNSWITNADTKVSISSGVFSVIVASIVFIAERILSNIDRDEVVNSCMYGCFKLSLILTLLAFVISITFHLLAICPNFKGQNKDITSSKDARFSVFYEEIQHFANATDYINASKRISEIEFAEEVLKEVYYNSSICSKKMKRFKIGIVFGGVTILLAIISGLFCYLSYIQ